MARYLSQYIPNDSYTTAPMRELLRKKIDWQWTNSHDAALQQLKKALVESPTFTFYDVTQPVTIQCDASQAGLGTCLFQHRIPVANASRSISTPEKNYAQIEKEMLSITFALRKFHQYIYSKKCVVVENDYQPLETTMKKLLTKCRPDYSA